MSVEALLGSRAERIMEKTISIETKGGYKKSPVYLAAAAFCRQGREGLREITVDLKRERIDFDPEKDFMRDLPNKYRQSAYLNFAACVFGISIIFNERAMVEKEVDLRQITASYNWVFYDTFIPQFEEAEEPKEGYLEKLSSDQHAELLALVDIKHPDKANRSLSRLYTDKINSMPKIIRRFLEHTNTLPTITDDFLPRYNWLVEEFIILNAKEMAEMR